MTDPVSRSSLAPPSGAQSSPAFALPRTPHEVQALAAGEGWQVPEACMPGVIANLGLLARHAAIFSGEGAGA
ncbi:hypothetical protein NUTIK01_04150 [Novosphingobium sp. IK01]|uniref:Uncharacterized protein n=1 Tax=Novosphingobium pituita TaxID=3056842 RepID=A0ABQ6P331_9SPHN|nr:hypothetical protein NUTIK01_04150 [Novosphingobium sp. IK01]